MPTKQANTLGNRILFVVDCHKDCVHNLRAALSEISDIETKRFTLIRCIPPALWENGGNTAENEIVLARKRGAFQQTEKVFDSCTRALGALGVPGANIRQVISKDTYKTADAVMQELQQNYYTGVIVWQCQQDTIDRLEGRGLLNALRRQKPRVNMWVLDQ